MSLQDSSDRTSDQARRGTPLRWKVGDDVKTALLSVYQHTPYPSASMRREISAKFGVTEKQVQVWFRNQRQREKYTVSMSMHADGSLTPFSSTGNSGLPPHANGNGAHAAGGSQHGAHVPQQLLLDPRLYKPPVQMVGRPPPHHHQWATSGCSTSSQSNQQHSTCPPLPPQLQQSAMPQQQMPLPNFMQQPSYQAPIAPHNSMLHNQMGAGPQHGWPGMGGSNSMLPENAKPLQSSPMPSQWSGVSQSMQMQQQFMQQPQQWQQQTQNQEQLLMQQSQHLLLHSQYMLPHSQQHMLPHSQQMLPHSQQTFPQSQEIPPQSQQMLPQSQQMLPQSQQMPRLNHQSQQQELGPHHQEMGAGLNVHQRAHQGFTQQQLPLQHQNFQANQTFPPHQPQPYQPNFLQYHYPTQQQPQPQHMQQQLREHQQQPQVHRPPPFKESQQTQFVQLQPPSNNQQQHLAQISHPSLDMHLKPGMKASQQDYGGSQTTSHTASGSSSDSKDEVTDSKDDDTNSKDDDSKSNQSATDSKDDGSRSEQSASIGKQESLPQM